MAVYTAAELAEVTALGTSETQVFSNSNKCIIKQIMLANYTATDRTVEIKVIPSGDTTGDQHIIFGDKLKLALSYSAPLLDFSFCFFFFVLSFASFYFFISFLNLHPGKLYNYLTK